MLAYWESKLNGRSMPRRSDIEPAEMVGLLPNIMIVDVVDDARRFVYRLVGTGEVQLRGDGYFAATPDAAEERYQRILDIRVPYYEEDNFQMVDRYICEANLFLPLSDDDRTVNKILVFSINRDLYRSR
jgi:hypothetical protein